MSDKLGTVRDVIHDYIYYTVSARPGEVSEKDIIDSEWVQRLRQIFQLQSAWLIYPGAVHLRFQHSIGVMQLAGDIAYKIYPQFKEAFPDEHIPERNYVEELFRLAGLLHDIGHGPFGHLLDDVYTIPKHEKTHEDISSSIILKELSDMIIRIRRSPHGTFHAPISAKQVVKFIKIPENFKKYSLWEQVFAKIMIGIYSADAIDFLLRDQYYCGTREFGTINFRNLIDNTSITKNGLTLNRKALPAFRAYIQTRFNMFRYVYLYEKNELYDLAFGKLLPEVLRHMRLGNPIKNLGRFKKITDFGLHYSIPNWSSESGERGKIGKEWRRMLLRRDLPFIKVMDKETFYSTVGEVSQMPKKQLLENEIRNRFGNKKDMKILISRTDIRLQNQFLSFEKTEEFRNNDNMKALSLYDNSNKEFCVELGNDYIRDIPIKYEVIRAYIPEQSWDLTTEHEEDHISQGELFSAGDIKIDERSLRSDRTSM